jgi:hypothetical protein
MQSVTTGRGGAGRIPEPGGDHGYDEAHQDLPRGTADPVEAGPTPPPPEDLGGDYGYDEAHDFRT